MLTVCRHRFGYLEFNLLTPRALNALPNLCPNLRLLDVSHLPALGACALAHSTGASLHLHPLYGFTSLTRRGLRVLADHCTTLRFLDIGAVPGVEDAALDPIGRSPLGAVFRTLVLSERIEASDESMRSVGEQCTSLMSLTMRDLLQLTDAGLVELCRVLGAYPNLRRPRLQRAGARRLL